MPWQGVHGRDLFRVLDHGIPKPFWLTRGLTQSQLSIFVEDLKVSCFQFLILRLNANLQFVRIFIFRGCSFFRGEFVLSLRSDRDTSHFAVCSAIRHSVEQLAAAQPRSCRQRAVKLASLSVSTVDDDAQRALHK